MENEDEAIIGVYRIGSTDGTFTNEGNGTLSIASYDNSVKGIIKINGWNGATFEVSESDGSPFISGEKNEFNFVF